MRQRKICHRHLLRKTMIVSIVCNFVSKLNDHIPQ